MELLRSLFVLSAGLPLISHADTLVIPPGSANQAGNGFSVGGFTASTSGQQTVYGSKNFPGAVNITGIAFRADEGADQFSSSFDVVIPRFTIRLSTYSGTPSTFSNNYFVNKGPDETLVFDGSVHWTGVNLPGNIPNPFVMAINFTTPFAYDPAGGALFMEYDSSGPTSSSVAIPVDFHSHGDFSIGFSWSNGLDPSNLATQFSYESVPEPSTTLMIAVFGLALIAGSRRRE